MGHGAPLYVQGSTRELTLPLGQKLGARSLAVLSLAVHSTRSRVEHLPLACTLRPISPGQAITLLPCPHLFGDSQKPGPKDSLFDAYYPVFLLLLSHVLLMSKELREEQ